MYKHLKTISKELKNDYPLTSQYVKGIYGLARKLNSQMSTNKAVDTHEDFFQAMITEACKLEPKFDPERGTSFYTFINRPLRAQMFKQFVSVDTDSQDYQDIKSFVRSYEKEHHLYPSVEIISEGTNLPSDLIRLEYYGKVQEVSIYDSDELVDEAPASTPNPKDYVKFLEPDEQMVINLMFSDIPPESAAAFTMHYLSLSRPALDSIMESALTKLKALIMEDF